MTPPNNLHGGGKDARSRAAVLMPGVSDITYLPSWLFYLWMQVVKRIIPTDSYHLEPSGDSDPAYNDM